MRVMTHKSAKSRRMAERRASRPGHRSQVCHLLIVVLLGFGCGSPAPRTVAPEAGVGLIPRPERLARSCSGAFRVGPATRVEVSSARARPVAARLAAWLGIPSERVGAVSASSEDRILLTLGEDEGRDPSRDVPTRRPEEAFTLDVKASGVHVRAVAPAGLFYGAQAFAQLAGSRTIASRDGRPVPPRLPRPVPCVHVEDSPRFSYRGMHLDVARHFFDAAMVKRYVDLLAYYRLDVFHWHLTDDQGFRIAIGSHPELAAVSAPRVYRPDEIRDVVQFARERFVTVVPEVEMPGHARAILASHPELSCTGARQPVPTTWGVFDDVLCAGNPATYDLVRDVLADVTTQFPSRLVHVGGDEVPPARWDACPKCRASMAGKGAEALQTAFVTEVTRMLVALGRRPMAWDATDRVDASMPGDVVLMAWQSEAKGQAAARAGRDVVMVPSDRVYFNFRQSLGGSERVGHEGHVPWPSVLAFDPARDLSATDATHVLGGEGALWTEYVPDADALETLLLPRLAALSEALWSTPPADPRGFGARFEATRPDLDAMGVRYFGRTNLREDAVAAPSR